MTARFITFEGGEGVGKTTLINFLEDELLRLGFQVIKTREPGGSRFGDQLRKILLETEGPLDTMAELLLLLAARAEHLSELILPALQSGKVVLCDRFNDSTIAYQGKARGLGMEKVEKFCEEVCQGTLPELTFYLDLDPQVGLERTAKLSKENAGAGLKDRIESEKLSFHETVRKAFLELAGKYPKRIKLIDASLPLAEVKQQALKTLLSHIGHVR